MTISLTLKDVLPKMEIFSIYKDDELAGGLEGHLDIDKNTFYIENIRKDDNYKGRGLLKEVVEELYDNRGYDLYCLPLPKYRPYYEELGFEVYEQNGEDIYYRKVHLK